MQTARASFSCRTSTLRPAVRGRVRHAIRAQRVGEDVPNVFKGQKLNNTGYVDVDNTGKGNVFPTLPKMYVNSATADEAAKQGLGGTTGLIVLAAIVGVVGLVGAGALTSGPPETLETVSDAFSGESLTAIASRIQASL